MLPVEILREAVESYAPYLQASGVHRSLGVQYWRERRVPQEETSLVARGRTTWIPQK